MNKTSAAIIAGAIGVSALIAGCAGLQFDDIVKVRTPIGLQQDMGLPPQMTLSEARVAYEESVNEFKTRSQVWRESIDDASAFVGVAEQLTLQGINEIGPSIMGIPVLGPSLPLLGVLTGLFFKRPGDASKKEVEEKTNAAWDEAFAAGKAAALEAVNAART